MLRALAGTAAVLLALGCLPSTLARLQGGTGNEFVALLAVLVPLTLPVLVVAVALALLAVRPWRWAGRRAGGSWLRGFAVLAVAVVLLAVHGAWVLPSLLPSGADAGASAAAAPGTTTRLRVLALNMEFGEADAAQVVGVVRREHVDVLAAVELTPDAVSRLRAAGLESVLPHSDLLPESGASGSGLWSRYPLTSLDPVSGLRFRAPRARLALPSTTVVVAAVHPSPPTYPADAVRDLHRLAAATAADAALPRIVAGDFNASRDVAPFRGVLATGLVDAADEAGLRGGAWPGLTWPADRAFPPVLRLDHVLVSPGHFAVESVRTVQVDGTDHRGVLAALVAR